MAGVQVLYVKVSASLPVDVPAGASSEDVRTAMNVKSISADEPIQMLVTDPDKFFGRTRRVHRCYCPRRMSSPPPPPPGATLPLRPHERLRA